MSPKKTETHVFINVRAPKSLVDAARERARREDETLSQVVRRFLREYADGGS